MMGEHIELERKVIEGLNYLTTEDRRVMLEIIEILKKARSPGDPGAW